MKKRNGLFFLLILCVCFTSFIACERFPKNSSMSELDRFVAQNGKVKVLSTTAMIGDIVQQVGGEYIDHLTLIVGEVDPHSYELVKGDDEKMQYAHIIFYNGLGLEHGASLQYKLQHHSYSVALGDSLLQKMNEKFLYVDNQIDPHIWMDVSFWKETIPVIVHHLSEKDPDHRLYFAERGDLLSKELENLDREIHRKLQSIPESKRYLVTSHDAFNYFTRSYLAVEGEKDWKKRFAAPEGLAPDGQLSAAHIQEIIDHLLKYQITVMFPESNVSRDSLKKIKNACKEKGFTIEIPSSPLYGDAMGDKAAGTNTYKQMMLSNANVICKEILRDCERQ